MPKKKQQKKPNRNKTKKIRTNLDLTADSWIEKYETILKKFEIRIFQLIAKILLNQQSFNQIRTCLTGHNQIWYHSIYQKILKYFHDLPNQNFSVLWLKWTQIMEIKQNQTFFDGIYSNLTPYLFYQKNTNVFQ